MTKQDALKKIEELKAYVDGLDKAWPQVGDEYKYVCSDGSVSTDIFTEGYHTSCRAKIGNIFRTSEEAKQHALRLESIAKRDWIPEVGDEYWVWSFMKECPTRLMWDNDTNDHFNYYTGIFKTKQEAREWGEKYADAWKIPDSN